MDNPAILQDLAELGYELPEDTPTHIGAVQARLDQVWRALQAELRKAGTSADVLLASEYVSVEDLRDVVVNATMRVLDNPDGLESEQIDDYRYTRANASADIYFTKAELRRLMPPWATQDGTAGSLRYSR